jgi:putative Holliday junction resolvase
MNPALAIDYGKKRCGLAITDDLRIIASPLETVATETLLSWLRREVPARHISDIVFGMPYRLSGEASALSEDIRAMAAKVARSFPTAGIHFVDETFTSKMAGQALVAGGMKKKDRRKKENLDKVSAALILQSYLGL